MYETINGRIKKIREHFCNDSNKVFANEVGEKPNTVNNWIREGYSVSRGVASKLTEKFPVDLNWLLSGEGEMLRPITINQQKSHIEGRHGGVGQVNGGNVNIHHDEGKDQVINEQKKEVDQMFKVLVDEIHGFQEIGKNHDEYVIRQDDYIKKQDEYIARIIKESYLRNERNMERIDNTIKLISENSTQMNKLLEMFAHQN
ncbi:MAG: hypothetical protein LBV41_03045, partial [Cytophagaceae bacterium]|nr:hypothetical protein [Cytophagaceae bacterium]